MFVKVAWRRMYWICMSYVQIRGCLILSSKWLFSSSDQVPIESAQPDNGLPPFQRSIQVSLDLLLSSI